MLILDRSVPVSLQIAACIWVLAGTVNLFTALTFMGLTYSVTLGALVVALGVTFIGMGLQTLTGGLKDTLLCGGLSLLSSLAAVRDLEGVSQLSLGSILLVALLFAASLLSILGRNSYRTRGLRLKAAYRT